MWLRHHSAEKQESSKATESYCDVWSLSMCPPKSLSASFRILTAQVWDDSSLLPRWLWNHFSPLRVHRVSGSVFVIMQQTVPSSNYIWDARAAATSWCVRAMCVLRVQRFFFSKEGIFFIPEGIDWDASEIRFRGGSMAPLGSCLVNMPGCTLTE